VARRDRPSPVGLAAWESFLRTHLALTRRLDHELVARHGLPLDWYDVLVQLQDAGGEASMGGLATRLLISPSTCTRVVGRMADAGLVERRIDEADARVRHAAITPEGKARLRAAAVTHLAGVQRHFARFVPADEAATLRDRFEAMRDSAVAAPDGSAGG
jgi:DNA-binding MarR family transcriptional regulator